MKRCRCIASEVERCSAEDADRAGAWCDARRDAGEMVEEGGVGFFDADVVGFRAVGVNGDGRDAVLLFNHACKGLEVGANDGRDGRADEGDERKGATGGLVIFNGRGDMGDEVLVAAEDSVHVAEGGARKDTLAGFLRARWPVGAFPRKK